MYFYKNYIYIFEFYKIQNMQKIFGKTLQSLTFIYPACILNLFNQNNYKKLQLDQ